MPFYVDRSGSLFEADPQTPQDLDTLLRQGLAPATEDDKARHNHAEDVKERQSVGFLDEGGAVDAYTNAALRLTGGLGTVAPDERIAEASSDDARLTAEAYPLATGLGRSVPLAPIAAGVGMATGGLGGVAGAVLGEGAVEGTAQEYDDAWLEQRPMELQKVATNTLLFAGTDGILRGVLGAAARAANPGTSMVVRRNIVAEAAGRAANTTRTRAARDVAETIGGWAGGAVGAKVAGPLGAMVGRKAGRKVARSLFGDVAEEGAEAAVAPEIVSVTSTPNPASRVARETVEAVPEAVPAPQAAPGAAVEAVAGDDLEGQLAASIEAARAQRTSGTPAQGLTPATRKPEVPKITRSRGAQHFGPDMPKSKKVYGPDEGPDLEAQLRASVDAASAYNAALREVSTAGSELTARRARQFLGKREPSGKGALTVFAGGLGISAALERKRGELDAISSDPAQLIESLSANTGDLVQTHPAVFQAMVGKVAGIAVYLKQSMPLRTGQTPLNPKGYPPPADEQMSWAYKYVGATLPEPTLRDVARGQAMPEQIQALRDNWPELIQDFQVNVLGAITAATERGHEIPRERVRQIEDLMGQPGGLDPTMSVAMWQSFDAAFAQEEAKKQQKAPQSGGGGPQLASTFQTRLASVQAQRTMV